MAPKLETLREKMETLTAREVDVLKELEYAEMQPGNKRRQEVAHWLDAVAQKRAKVVSIEKEYQHSGLISSVFQYMDGRIEQIVKDVQDLIEMGKFPNSLVMKDPMSKEVPFNLEPSFGEKFQQNVEIIEKWLQDPLACCIGLHGMGGVGKTTLLKHMYNKLLSTGKCVHWVTASKDCSLSMLQQKIAKAMGVDLSDEEVEDRRAAMLHTSLDRIGKAVLIIDDVWESLFTVESIGIPNGENGCKIILSTRKIEVCRSMGCKDYVIRVQSLSEDEAWELFMNRLETYDKLELEAKHVATLVAKECGCLPLAVIVIGRSMKGVCNKWEWQNALDELKNPSRGQEDMEEKVLQTLKFSFDNLKNDLLKHCFLSCVLYPEDWCIERKELIEMWIMEGMLDDVGSKEEKLNKGQTILDKLENACLLESYYSGNYVKMHDVVRDMGIMITNGCPRFIVKAGLGLQEVLEEKLWSNDVVKVSFMSNHIKEISCDVAPLTPRLKVLKLFENPLEKMPESFFDHMRALTVLDLSHTEIERVPESVSNLENLRALLLVRCYNLTYVPSLAKLTSLRVLDLRYTYWLKEGPKGLEGLKQLEKLLCYPWNVSDMTGFNKLIRFLTSLNHYYFMLRPLVGDYDDIDWDVIEQYERVVYIVGAEMGEDDTMLLPTSSQSLGFENCEMKGKRSLTAVFPSFAGAAHLESMWIQDSRGFEYIASSSSSSCVQLETLEYLRLVDLPDLTRIVGFGGCSFLRLRQLEIMFCPKIKVVFPFTKQLSLPHLKSIEVTDCEEVEQIFESNHDMEHNPVIYVPKLRKIKLKNLAKLGSIYRGLLLCNNEVVIDVDDCPNVEILEESEGEERVICDASFTTLRYIASHPACWETFNRICPLLAPRISYQITQLLQWDSSPAVVDDDKDDTSEWGASLSLFSSTS